MKIKTCVISFVVFLTMTVIILSGCFLLPIMPWERKEMYSYYCKDSNYVEVYGKLINKINYNDNSAWWFLKFDEEFISENQELCNKYFPNNTPRGLGFKVTDKTQEVLLESGFYDLLLDESEIDKTAEYPALIEETIYVVTSYKTWWNMAVPVIEVKVGDTIYLDYETGKANWLGWIQNEMY